MVQLLFQMIKLIFTILFFFKGEEKDPTLRGSHCCQRSYGQQSHMKKGLQLQYHFRL